MIVQMNAKFNFIKYSYFYLLKFSRSMCIILIYHGYIKQAFTVENMPKSCFEKKKLTLMIIFDRKTLSNRDKNRKFVIFRPDLPKTDIRFKRGLCKCFTKKTSHAQKNKKIDSR